MKITIKFQNSTAVEIDAVTELRVSELSLEVVSPNYYFIEPIENIKEFSVKTSNPELIDYEDANMSILRVTHFKFGGSINNWYPDRDAVIRQLKTEQGRVKSSDITGEEWFNASPIQISVLMHQTESLAVSSEKGKVDALTTCPLPSSVG